MTLLLAILTLVGAPAGHASEPGSRVVPPEEMSSVEAAAKIYGIDPAKTRQQYETMFGSDDIKANAAAVFFAQAKAYDILAIALVHLDDTTPQYAVALGLLVSKKSFDRKVFDALITELDRLIAIPVSSGNEVEGGRLTSISRIARAVEGWLNLPAPSYMVDPEPLRAFCAAAKKKAAFALVDSPY